jgi:quercetin dioxygenase-like cupin family protein
MSRFLSNRVSILAVLRVLVVAILTLIPIGTPRSQPRARPELVVRQVVEGMPKGDKQEIRVFTASLKPGDQTVFHTHRFPVTVYILEGAFTLEMEGRAPVTVKAGDAFVEPPNVKMTGYNRSTSDPIRLVIFYVSDPETPFLDPIP